MKFRRTNKVGKFEVKKVKNKGAVSKNVVHVAMLWQHERPKEVEKYDLLVEKNRVATRRKTGV